MRLLKEDDVLDIIERVTNDAVENKKPKYLIQKRIIAEIAALKPVDAEFVRYAFWKFKEDRAIVDGKDWVCSNCRKAQRCKENYCPNCGARMDGGVEDEND